MSHTGPVRSSGSNPPPAVLNHEAGLEVLHGKGNWPTLRQENDAFRKFIQNIVDGFDCDSDGHKYGTYCRSCDAKKLLEQYPLDASGCPFPV